MTVKEQRNIETNELIGYVVDGVKFVPIDKGNRDYKEVLEWIAKENTPEPAYTDIDTFNYFKNKKINEINNTFEAEMALITSQYPETEKLSWDKQEQEARAYLADDTAITPMLDAIATARGIDKATLALRIVDKADAYSLAVGSAIGKRQALEDAVNSILLSNYTDVNLAIAKIEAIVW